MDVVGKIVEQIINPLIYLLFALALVYFFFGVVKFLSEAGGGEVDKAESKQHLFWGIIGLVVMASVFGIMTVLSNTIYDLAGEGPGAGTTNPRPDWRPLE